MRQAIFSAGSQAIPPDGSFHHIAFDTVSSDTGDVVTYGSTPVTDFTVVEDGWYSILLLLNFYDDVYPETAAHYWWDFGFQFNSDTWVDGWTGPATGVPASSAYNFANQQLSIPSGLVWLYKDGVGREIQCNARNNLPSDGTIHLAELYIARLA